MWAGFYTLVVRLGFKRTVVYLILMYVLFISAGRYFINWDGLFTIGDVLFISAGRYFINWGVLLMIANGFSIVSGRVFIN